MINYIVFGERKHGSLFRVTRCGTSKMFKSNIKSLLQRKPQCIICSIAGDGHPWLYTNVNLWLSKVLSKLDFELGKPLQVEEATIIKTNLWISSIVTIHKRCTSILLFFWRKKGSYLRWIRFCIRFFLIIVSFSLQVSNDLCFFSFTLVKGKVFQVRMSYLIFQLCESGC